MTDQTDVSGFIASLQGPIRARIIGAATAATNEIAEMTLARARELCPVSPTNPTHEHYLGTSGALRDSGTAKPAELRGNEIRAEVGFHTNYAAAVHERLDANHKYPGAANPNAQAKYLSTAADEIRPKAPGHMQRRMRQAW